MVQGQLKQEFKILWDYLGEIKRGNPGSAIKMRIT